MPAGQKTRLNQASSTISQADTDTTTTTTTTLERNSHNHKAKSAINCNAHRISIGYRSQQRQQKRLACLALTWPGLMYVHGIREIQLLWMIKQQKAPRILLQLVVVASYSDLWLAFSRTMSTKGIGL